ncbi:hypothetical protein [Bacillus marinisedimentorum]|nr:hypothetical protein [Bacillus marinisedimentorum]
MTIIFSKGMEAFKKDAEQQQTGQNTLNTSQYRQTGIQNPRK